MKIFYTVDNGKVQGEFISNNAIVCEFEADYRHSVITNITYSNNGVSLNLSRRDGEELREQLEDLLMNALDGVRGVSEVLIK